MKKRDVLIVMQHSCAAPFSQAPPVHILMTFLVLGSLDLLEKIFSRKALERIWHVAGVFFLENFISREILEKKKLFSRILEKTFCLVIDRVFVVTIESKEFPCS